MAAKTLTLAQVADLEGISTRQALRYVRDGYKGLLLPAAKRPKGFVVAVAAYQQWRAACGFEQPAAPTTAKVVGPAPTSPEEVRPVTSSPEEPLPAPCAELFPPWPQCADPNGIPTNVPDPHSCTMPHPLAVEAHRAQQLREQLIRYRGYD